MKTSDIAALFKETYQDWSEDKAPRLAAAFAYYTLFSLAPLLIVIMGIAGLVFGQKAASGQLAGQIQQMVGPQAAEAIQAMVANARKPSSGVMATVIGIVTLLLGAGGVFGQLQDALNTVWGVVPKPGRGFMVMIKERFLSFSMVLGVGFLLLVSLVISAAIEAAAKYVGGIMPGLKALWTVTEMVVSFGVVTLLFAMIYKELPDVKIAWRDVWTGAILTAIFFTLGKFAIGLYLGRSGVASSYGAAGSLVVLMLWIYYSAQILFFGAEFTKVYAMKFGSKIEPNENAIAVSPKMRAEQGMPKPGQVGAASKPAYAPPPGPAIPQKQFTKGFEKEIGIAGIAGAVVGLIVGFVKKPQVPKVQAKH